MTYPLEKTKKPFDKDLPTHLSFDEIKNAVKYSLPNHFVRPKNKIVIYEFINV
jgi:hypothetical protein